MAWWNKNSKPDDEPDPNEVNLVYGEPGTIIPCDNPENAVVIPKDPEPDLSTKPKDVVGYCFGYACPKKHVQNFFESVTVDGYKERKACQTCGGVSKPAVIKRTAKAQWGNKAQPHPLDIHPKPRWGWYNSYWNYVGKTISSWPTDKDMLWTKHEFVHYLESPRRRKK
jgi:hypothetical protein